MESKVKVLLTTGHASNSGANHSLVKLAENLITNNIDVKILLSSEGEIVEVLKKNNIPYSIIRYYPWVREDKIISTVDNIEFIIKKMINRISDIKISKLIKNENIDIVHINAITFNMGYKAAKKNGKLLVWHIRELLKEDLNSKFINEENALLQINNADQVIAVSESVKKSHHEKVNSIKVIYNGIDVNRYSDINNNLFQQEKIVITIVGRLIKQKGQLEAIQAVSKLIKKGYPIILQIVGSNGDSNYIKTLEETIVKLEMTGYIHFLGYQNNIENVWGKTDIALVCSVAEAFGRVTIEAMMAGAIVIGADTAGTKELIKDNKYGVLYEQGNYKSLSTAIETVINNKKYYIDIAINSKRYAMENYSATSNAERIKNTYTKLISGL